MVNSSHDMKEGRDTFLAKEIKTGAEQQQVTVNMNSSVRVVMGRPFSHHSNVRMEVGGSAHNGAAPQVAVLFAEIPSQVGVTHKNVALELTRPGRYGTKKRQKDSR
jgi:hypothetical protein